MALVCGIVGLPNVGKSTIFSALTKVAAAAENFPFCTIEPNTGIVAVPDESLDFLSSVYKPVKKTNAVVKFVDIAGLIKGASKGEGLGNKFLANIRECSAIVHVVRCFDNADIMHVREDANTAAPIDPKSDILTINFELCQADLATLDAREAKNVQFVRQKGHEAQKILSHYNSAIKKIRPLLESGTPARCATLTDEEEEAVADLFLLTKKPCVYAANIDEDAISSGGNKYTKEVATFAKNEGARCVLISGKLECDLSEMGDDAEKREFMEAAGLKESALSTLAREVYSLMGLMSFYTAGVDECRAWTIKCGTKAPAAAGTIHTDMEAGFVKAEVYSVGDLRKYGSVDKIKAQGLLRQEGKDYIVQDSDVIFVKFNGAKNK